MIMQIRPFKIKISVFSWELFSVFNGFVLDPDPQPPFCFSLACYFFFGGGGGDAGANLKNCVGVADLDSHGSRTLPGSGSGIIVPDQDPAIKERVGRYFKKYFSF